MENEEEISGDAEAPIFDGWLVKDLDDVAEEALERKLTPDEMAETLKFLKAIGYQEAVAELFYNLSIEAMDAAGISVYEAIKRRGEGT